MTVFVRAYLDSWSHKLGAKNLPEMVFGKNQATFEHANSSFKMSFLPFDALSTIIHDPQYIPKVSYAQEWLSRLMRLKSYSTSPANKAH